VRPRGSVRAEAVSGSASRQCRSYSRHRHLQMPSPVQRASWCLLPRPHSAPLQTGSATPNYEVKRTPEVHATGAWTLAISMYSCVLSSAELKPPLVLSLQTHFQIPRVLLATRDWRRAFGPLGTRKGNTTARASSAKVVLADVSPDYPGTSPAQQPADPRPI